MEKEQSSQMIPQQLIDSIQRIYDQDLAYAIHNPAFINESNPKQSASTNLQSAYQEAPQFSEIQTHSTKLNFHRFHFSWLIKKFDEPTWIGIAKDFLKKYKFNLKGESIQRKGQMNNEYVETLFDDQIYENYRWTRAYTQGRGLYQILNYSIRTQSKIQFLSNLRYPIKKLYQEIMELGEDQLRKQNQNGKQSYIKTFYRGIRYLSKEEQQLFERANKNQSIFQIEGFLSTSKSKQRAQNFYQKCNFKCLMQIQVDLPLPIKFEKQKSNQEYKGGFADITKYSVRKQEKQVLFTPLCYFVFKDRQMIGDVLVLTFEYIDIQTLCNKETLRHGLQQHEKKILQNYKRTQLIANSQIRNQGGLYFVDGNSKKYYEYHVAAATMAIREIQKYKLDLTRFDDFIDNHKNKLVKMADKFSTKGTQDFLSKFVFFLYVYETMVSQTFTSSFILSYHYFQQDVQVLYLQYDLLVKEQNDDLNKRIIITIMAGILADPQFLKKKPQIVSTISARCLSIEEFMLLKMVKNGSGYVEGMKNKIMSKRKINSPFTWIGRYFFEYYQLTPNLWVDKGLYDQQIFKINFVYVSILIDNSDFNRAQQILDEIKRMDNSRKKYKVQGKHKKQEPLDSIQMSIVIFEAQFYMKKFLHLSDQSSPQSEQCYQRARQKYCQILEEQRYHQVICQEKYKQNCQQSKEYLEKIKERIRINLARLDFYGKKGKTQQLKNLEDFKDQLVKIEACILSDDQKQLIEMLEKQLKGKQQSLPKPNDEDCLIEDSSIQNLIESSRYIMSKNGGQERYQLNKLIDCFINFGISPDSSHISYDDLLKRFQKKKWQGLMQNIGQNIKAYLQGHKSFSPRSLKILEHFGEGRFMARLNMFRPFLCLMPITSQDIVTFLNKKIDFENVVMKAIEQERDWPLLFEEYNQ